MSNEGIGSVSVTAFPGGHEAVELRSGDTVRDAVERAGFEAASGRAWQVQINGGAATMDSTIQNGDRITLTEQIKGN